MVTARALSAGRCAAALGALEGQGQSQRHGGTAGAVLPGHALAGTVLGVLSYPKKTVASRVSEKICGDSKSLPECLSQERRQAAPRSGCRCPRRALLGGSGRRGAELPPAPCGEQGSSRAGGRGELWALPAPTLQQFLVQSCNSWSSCQRWEGSFSAGSCRVFSRLCNYTRCLLHLLWCWQGPAGLGGSLQMQVPDAKTHTVPPAARPPAPFQQGKGPKGVFTPCNTEGSSFLPRISGEEAGIRALHKEERGAVPAALSACSESEREMLA